MSEEVLRSETIRRYLNEVAEELPDDGTVRTVIADLIRSIVES